MFEDDKNNLSRLIAGARKDKGLTQADLSEMLGYEYNIVSVWENGSARPKLENMIRVAEILKIPTTTLKNFGYQLD